MTDTSTVINTKVKTLVEVLPGGEGPIRDVILESSLGIPGSNNGVPRGRSIGQEDIERVNVKTKVFHNGVEVLVVDKNDEEAGNNTPPELEPTTVSEQLFMGLPTRHHQFANFLRSAMPELVTRTFYTTVTFYYTPPPGGANDVEQRTKIISNVVTQEADAYYGPPKSSAEVTLTTDYLEPPMDVKTQVTKFTYYNTLYYGDQPLVLSTEEVISNIATVPKDSQATSTAVQPSPVETKTYFSTYVFYKTVTEDDIEKVLSTEEVITQVVVTRVFDEPELQAAEPADEIFPANDDTDSLVESSIAYTDAPELIKTYFTTFTYMTTALVGDETVVSSDVIIKSEVVKEPVNSPVFDFGSEVSVEPPQESDKKEEIMATRTYYVSYTYLSTIQYGDLTTVQSNVEVSSSIVVEPLDASENPSLWSELVSATVTPTSVVPELQSSALVPAEDDTRKQTVTYYRLGPNVYAQLRTVFATYATVVTGDDGFLETVNKVQSDTVTSTITTTAVPSDVTVIDSRPPTKEELAVKSTSTAAPAQTVDPTKASVITGSTVIFFNKDGKPNVASSTVAPQPVFDKTDATKTTVTAIEATTVAGSDGKPTVYPGGQVLVIVDLGNGSSVGFPITGIDMSQKPLQEGTEKLTPEKADFAIGQSESVSQSFSSSSSQFGSLPDDLGSFASSISSVDAGNAKPSAGTATSGRPAGNSFISSIGTGLVNLGALAGALAAGNAGAQAVSGLDFSPLIESVTNLFTGGASLNPFGRRNDSDSRRDSPLRPDRLRFPAPGDDLLPPRPPAVRNQQRPAYIPLGNNKRPGNSPFLDEPVDFQELSENTPPPFIPLRGNSIGSQKRPRPIDPQQERPQGGNFKPRPPGPFGEPNLPQLPPQQPRPHPFQHQEHKRQQEHLQHLQQQHQQHMQQLHQQQQQHQQHQQQLQQQRQQQQRLDGDRPQPGNFQPRPSPPGPFGAPNQQQQPPRPQFPQQPQQNHSPRPFAVVQQPEFIVRPPFQQEEIERQETEREKANNNPGTNFLRGNGVAISPGQVLVARPDDDSNVVIGTPANIQGDSRRPQFPSHSQLAPNPSSVQLGQSIRIGNQPEPSPSSQAINPSPVSVISGQETIFFNKPTAAPLERPQQPEKRPADTDRVSDIESEGNLLGSADTQQPSTVPAPVLPQELPSNPRRPTNPLLKERRPPPIHLPRIISQGGQPQRPFPGQRAPNGPIIPPRDLQNRPLPPLVRDPDGAPLIAKLPNNPGRPQQRPSAGPSELPSRPQQQQFNAGWSSVQSGGSAQSGGRPGRPGVQWPAVQTVLSLGSGNRIVATNIIRNDGQEIEVEEDVGFRPASPPPQIAFTRTPEDAPGKGQEVVIDNSPKLRPFDLIESSQVERFPADQDTAGTEPKEKQTDIIKTGETTVFDVLYTRPAAEEEKPVVQKEDPVPEEGVEEEYYYDYESQPTTEQSPIGGRPSSLPPTNPPITPTERNNPQDDNKKPFKDYVPPPNRPRPPGLSLTNNGQPEPADKHQLPPYAPPPPRPRPGLPPPQFNYPRPPFNPLNIRRPSLPLPNVPFLPPAPSRKPPVVRPNVVDNGAPLGGKPTEPDTPLTFPPADTATDQELVPSEPVTPPVIIGYIEDSLPPSRQPPVLESSIPQQEEVTRYLTQTETVTQTMTLTETSIFHIQGRPFTKTEVVTTTLPPRTVVTTVVGQRTEVNVLTTVPKQEGVVVSSSVSSSSSSVINAVPEVKEAKLDISSISSVIPPKEEVSSTVYFPALQTTTVGLPTETVESEEVENEINRGVEDTNEINRVIAGFIPEQGLSAEVPVVAADCVPGCSLEDNELCQKKRGSWKCVCRPGFARPGPGALCRETRTFKLSIPIDRVQGQYLTFRDEFLDEKTPEFGQLEFMTKDAVGKALQKSALGQSYHDAEIMSFQRFNMPGKDPDTGVMVEIIAKVAPELNADEGMLMNHFRQSVRKSNFSVGETALFVSPSYLDSFYAEDFDECSHEDYNDCSEFSMCINRAGTFTCACKSGYQDLTDVADSRPGRICSSASSSCGHCNYHGECYTREDGSTACKCQKWYSGDRCQLNMKVLLIVLVTIGALLALGLCLATLVFCLRRKRPSSGDPRNYLYAASSGNRGRALDRRAMIGPGDTSSESSDHRSFPTMHEAMAPPSIGKKGHKAPRSVASGRSLDMDRSLSGTTTMPPVIIPRAKYSSPSRMSSGSQMVSLGPDPSADLVNAERSLMSVLEVHKQPQSMQSHKGSTRSHATSLGDDLRSERSGRRAFRERRGSDGALIDVDAIIPAIGSRSKSSGRRPSEYSRGSGLGDRTEEARSYDETTVRNVTRHPESLYYSSRPQSTHFFSEDGRTMADREDASSVWVPQSRLYRLAPDSDMGSETSSRRDRSSKISSSPHN